MDLIDRQAAIDALQKEINKGIPPFNDVFGSIRAGMRLARNIIEDLPATQLEIVRCKDCKHRPVMLWNEAYGDFDVLAPEVDGKEDWRCPCLIKDDPYYSWSPNDNWFCGNGERRECDADAEGKG